MPDSQIDLFWSSLFIQTVMKYIWYNHQPVPHVCRQTANKNARKLRVSEFVSSCGPLVSLVSWGGDEDSSDSWCDWLSTEMPLYIMSCIFTTPLMLQGLTRAVTCLLLLLSIKMYPQLGEHRGLYHIKVVLTIITSLFLHWTIKHQLMCVTTLLIVTWKQ